MRRQLASGGIGASSSWFLARSSPLFSLFSLPGSLVAAFTYIIIIMMIMTALGYGANGIHGHVAAWQRVSLDAVPLFSSLRRTKTYYRVARRNGRSELSGNSLPAVTCIRMNGIRVYHRTYRGKEQGGRRRWTRLRADQAISNSRHFPRVP